MIQRLEEPRPEAFVVHINTDSALGFGQPAVSAVKIHTIFCPQDNGYEHGPGYPSYRVDQGAETIGLAVRLRSLAPRSGQLACSRVQSSVEEINRLVLGDPEEDPQATVHTRMAKGWASDTRLTFWGLDKALALARDLRMSTPPDRPLTPNEHAAHILFPVAMQIVRCHAPQASLDRLTRIEEARQAAQQVLQEQSVEPVYTLAVELGADA